MLASSIDNGRSWQKLSGMWLGIARGLSALTINDNAQSIWFGGQGSIENPILREYSVATNTTKSHDNAVSALLPIPSTIEGIVFHPNNNNIIYAGGEGGIIKTEDGGQTWEEYHHPDDSLHGGVRAMQGAVNSNNNYILYFALQNGGLVEVKFNNEVQS